MSAALQPKLPRMTAAEFLAWTAELTDDTRYELVAGECVAMAPETLDHGRLKYRIARRLSEALEAGSLPCEVLVDSVGVQIDEHHVYIPDVLIRCGVSPSPSERTVDPLVVVEVASPSTRRVDEVYKTVGYFARPTLRHYLIVVSGARQIIHHARGEDGIILTHLHGDEPFRLDPPGVLLDRVFPPGSPPG